MSDFIYQIHSLLTTTPGSAAYHLILAFSIVWCLQYVISQLPNNTPQTIKKYTMGFSLLLLLQIILFLVSIASGSVFSKPQDLLPPLDRAVTVLSLWIILWLWSSPYITSRSNIWFLLGGIVTIIFFGTTFAVWQGRSTELFFNATLLSPLWGVYALVVCVVALLLLLNSKPNYWQIGTTFFIINGLFHFLALSFPILDGNYYGIIRFGQILTYPLLFSLTFSLTKPIGSPKISTEEVIIKPSPERMDAFIHHWLKIQKEFLNSSPAIIAQFFKAALQADEAFILAKSSASEELVLWYPTSSSSSLDHSTLDDDIPFSQASLSKKQLPLLIQALEKGKSIIIDAANQSLDLQTLKIYLGNRSSAHLLGVPLTNEPDFLAVILTKTEAAWHSKEENRANELAHWLNQSSAKLDTKSSLTVELGEWQENYSSLLKEVEKLKQDIEEKDQKIAHLPKLEETILSLQENLSLIKNQNLELQQMLTDCNNKKEELTKNLELTKQELNQIPEYRAKLDKALQKIEELQQVIEQKNHILQELQIKYENEKASIEKLLNQKKLEEKKMLQRYEEIQQQLDTQNNKVKLLESELEKAKNASEDLRKQLTELEKQSNETKEKLNQQMDQKLAEIAALAQELRYPMSTILDYSDLLLDESVGALGALQKKFLEKVKEGIKQLDDRVNQLVKNAVLEDNTFGSTSKVLDFQTALDKCLAVYEMDIQEKGLRIDTKETYVPSPLPLDKDAFHQIMVNLLRHSINIAPPRGNIRIKASVHEEETARQLLVQIFDDGEAIPKNELSLVFSPFYRPSYLTASRPGESEMGPSIAKTLIEALKGRIWMDSEEGKGNIFSFILPLPSSGEKSE